MTRMKGLFLCVLTLGWLQAVDAWAAAYVLSESKPDFCSGDWSFDSAQKTYLCSGNIVIASGDSVSAAENVTLKAVGSITLAGGNTLGSAGARINLRSQQSVTVRNAVIYGDVVSEGAGNVDIQGDSKFTSRIQGNISSLSEVVLRFSDISGNVSAAQKINGNGKNVRVHGSCTADKIAPTVMCASIGQAEVLNCFNDDFAGALDSEDWVVSSRGRTLFTPEVVADRLRLTTDSGNIATAASLLRLFPAEGNRIVLEFDYFAYSAKNNRGADGIAVILSDAEITPQPGGYGGSLGYAQRTGVPGFAGGWLGLGLDEYGNYSNPTEGRSGGRGFIRDAVALRGSGSESSGYRYLTGSTASLDPEVDQNVASSVPGPGHRYRVEIDSTTAGKVMVSVSRNTGSGSSFTPLVAPFDILKSTGQAPLPENFFLSLTGSTGGSVNFHELDNLEVCALKMNPVGLQIDHFQIETASGANTCSPQDVTVRACSNAAGSGSCVPYAGDVAVTLAGNGWVGGAAKVLHNGVGTFQLQGLEAEMPLGVLSSQPMLKPLGQTLCKVGNQQNFSTANCTLAFQQSGFVFDVPNMTANLAARDVEISAVVDKGNYGSARCEKAFAGQTRALSFWSDYIEPEAAALTVRPNVQVNEQPVGQSQGGATPLSLSFDASGVARLSVLYPEAGKLQLNVRYAGSASEGDTGPLSGSDRFVAAPAGFCVRPLEGACEAGSDCPKLRTVGEPLDFDIHPVAYERDSDTDFCAGNAVTRNYRQTGLQLEPRVVAPAAGMNGHLLQPADGRYDHLPPAGGESGWDAVVRQSVAFSEVGTFRLRVEPPPSQYLGEVTVPAAESVAVGRMVPAFLRVEGDIRVQPSCGTFSYQDQPMTFAGDGPLLTFSAWGRDSDGKEYLTLNYDRDGFWKLAAPAHSYSSVDPAGSAVNRLEGMGTPALLWLSESGVDNPGDGLRRLRIDGEMLAYRRAAMPSAEDQPFPLNAWLVLEKTALTDSDGVCASEEGSGCMDRTLSFSAGELRLGRVFSENAIAPEIPLAGMDAPQLLLPVRVEHWNGTAYQAASDSDDTCTQIVEQADKRILSGNLSEIEVGERTSLGFPVKALQGQDDRLDGSAALRFALSGTVDGVEMPAQWLCVKLPANAAVANGGVCGHAESVADPAASVVESGASATFGINAGQPPVIFRREQFR